MGKAVIGITTGHNKEFSLFKLNKCYTKAIIAAGGLPVILPVCSEMDIIFEYIKKIDGLLLTGGVDIDPLLYGENPLPYTGEIDPLRDKFELKLLKYAEQIKLPILGICKGCQLLNIVAGGSLYQDLNSQQEEILKHNQEAPRWYPTHGVSIVPESDLYKILKTEYLKVNSIHHQAIKDLSPCYRVVARADDGVIEAIEKKDSDFVLGIQWHPETMWENDQYSLKIFQEFVRHSKNS